jgi:acyl-CoA thioesterase-2
VNPTEILDVLRLDEIAPDQYVAQNLSDSPGVVFGGQLLAQAIAAAVRTVPDMAVKSMHTVFARGGSPDAPLELSVERLHAGRSFASVEVSIRQGDRLCTRSLVLLHRPDADLIRHADPAPAVASADDSPPPDGIRRGWEIRYVDGVDIMDPNAIGPAELFVWSRFAGIPEDPWVSQALLGYASDGFLIGTAMRPHPGAGQSLAHVSISTTVITQTLTFHDPFHAGDWLLLAQRSPHASSGRSFGRADVFTADGALVASFSQENMIRGFDTDRAPAAGERSKH